MTYFNDVLKGGISQRLVMGKKNPTNISRTKLPTSRFRARTFSGNFWCLRGRHKNFLRYLFFVKKKLPENIWFLVGFGGKKAAVNTLHIWQASPFGSTLCPRLQESLIRHRICMHIC